MRPYDPQDALSYPSDTATPCTPVPIFYLHSEERPFCLNPRCLCHVNDAHLRELLHGVLDRSLRLREVQNGCIRWAAGEGGSQ